MQLPACKGLSTILYFVKKNTSIFWFLVEDSRHLLQNPKVPKNVMGFNNHALKCTPPYHLDVDNPLKKIYIYIYIC